MPSFRSGEVVEVLSERAGLQRVRVALDGDAEPSRAYSLTQLTGLVAVGDRVVCNTTAVDLGLGTGGWHVVHWNLSRTELDVPGPDHIMKLRYTSLQADVGTSELVHPDLPETLDGTPVVVCQLHSQMGAVAAVLGALAPGRKVAYVMTDGAALPIAMSDLVENLRQRDLLTATITAGHAFGGDLEAVSLHSALLLARHVAGADVIIVAMGPGVVGTGTKYGTTALEAAAALDAVDALDGIPVLCVRASDGDGRERHQGISHHTRTVVELTKAAPLVAVVPHDVLTLEGVVPVEVDVPDVAAILDAAALRITSMGRGIDEDPLFFAAAAAAAVAATTVLE